MVDFATPAVDLIYSLYFQLSTENRNKYREEFIMYYHSEFVKALKSYGFLKKPPSLLDLQVELLKHGALEAIIVLGFLAFMFVDYSTLDPVEYSSPENLKKFSRKRYQDPTIQETIKRELPRLFYNGLI
jgi:hypothetical protein